MDDSKIIAVFQAMDRLTLELDSISAGESLGLNFVVRFNDNDKRWEWAEL